MKENTVEDLNRAIIFATERHAGQVRKGTDTPYIVHPLETMLILSNMQADLNVQIAGLLHDTVEDTDTTLEEIEEYNILEATYLAMKRAVEGLGVKPDFALVDGNRKPNTGIEEMTLVKGDAKSISIAAASILAKVSRDRYLLELDEKYPEYQFRKHKGYPTALHYEMIKEHGISPVHRLSFLKNLGEK